MNKTLSLIVVAVVFAAGPARAQKATTASTTVAGAPDPAATATAMRPGMWETTVTIQTAGADSRRTIVSRSCYAAADVGDVARVLPRHREPGMKCENKDVKPQAGKASWQIACTSAEGSLAGPAEVSYAGNSYVGKADLERKKKGAKAEKVSSTLSGKWIEACK
ncbi:MAG: DUF3617 family protein [Caldimonas sp.]